MQRMELTSFYLKLNELKEYDQAKQERQQANQKEGGSQAMTEIPAEKLNIRATKTKQEIHTRIGYNSTDSS